jgi:hypothetical protein
MKHIRTLVLVFACTASLAGVVYGASMSSASPAAQVRPWLGTWSCKAPGNNHTATFTPIFGGNGMRISETGKVPSEEIVVWDAKRHLWIDMYSDASGMYNTMEGTPSGKTIHFREVYPGPGATVLATMASKSTYSTTFTASMNGKMMQQRETCTRM